ncbi:MAG: hypothetical protein WCS75_05960 [Sphingomonas sp.]|jgi:hypothetical protein|uniref:hypothetical protein n=1 Tax=Sphingomonas sp. TaxID=28214 RepID=UPI00356A4EEF
MNAYSPVKSGRKASAGMRLRSPAFRQGLADGFGATAGFFTPSSYSRTLSIDATVDAAWKAVSSALNNASKTEAKIIGKTSDKKLIAD